MTRGATRPVLVSLARAAGFLALWIVLMGAAPADLGIGLVAAGAATGLSLRLRPPGPGRPRLLRLAGLAGRFLWQSIAAGWDIARRAFDPRLPLRPGFVTHRVGLPPGPARSVFVTITSLVPGTVPAGAGGDDLLYHCLDMGQPVAAQLAAEEAAWSRALNGSRDG